MTTPNAGDLPVNPYNSGPHASDIAEQKARQRDREHVPGQATPDRVAGEDDSDFDPDTYATQVRDNGQRARPSKRRPRPADDLDDFDPDTYAAQVRGSHGPRRTS